MFVHLDLDQFFVSAERLHRPELRGRPVVVGGSDPRARGAVACASYEARELGVHSGMALRRAHALCPQAVFVSGSSARYLELSRAVRQELEVRVPRVVPRSIDEFDVDLVGCERLLGDPVQLAQGLRAAVRARTGLTCSAGLAETPLVAKVASGQRKPDGFVFVPRGGGAAFLAPLPLRKLPGVGPRTEERLRELGLETIGELAAISPDLLLAALGARGVQLGERARGGSPRMAPARAVAFPFVGQDASKDDALWRERGAQDEAARHHERSLPRSLSRERTFAEDQDERAVLDAALVRLVEEAVGSLRAKRLRARSLALHVRYADLRSVSRHRRLPRDAEERRVVELARELLDRLLERRLRIRRIGVALLGIVPHHEQLTLFEGPRARSQRSLGLALDAIRDRHGFDSVHWAAGQTLKTGSGKGGGSGEGDGSGKGRGRAGSGHGGRGERAGLATSGLAGEGSGPPSGRRSRQRLVGPGKGSGSGSVREGGREGQARVPAPARAGQPPEETGVAALLRPHGSWRPGQERPKPAPPEPEHAWMRERALRRASSGGEPSAASGGEPSAASGGEPSAASGGEPSAASGGEPSAASGGEPGHGHVSATGTGTAEPSTRLRATESDVFEGG